jgi:hypothetical protein
MWIEIKSFMKFRGVFNITRRVVHDFNSIFVEIQTIYDQEDNGNDEYLMCPA